MSAWVTSAVTSAFPQSRHCTPRLTIQYTWKFNLVLAVPRVVPRTSKFNGLKCQTFLTAPSCEHRRTDAGLHQVAQVEVRLIESCFHCSLHWTAGSRAWPQFT